MIEQIYDIFLQHPLVVTDTRCVTKGSIFFALRGERFDGNNFALQALESGSAYAVVDCLELRGRDDRIIYVEDVLKTLQLLARHHRRMLNIPIIAITGSNGKTTTKELLAATLMRRYRTVSTVGNLNNHIGVPLTLLAMDSKTEVGIVEMGANAKGEIATLCEIAEPNYGIINNIGRAHLEGFGGEDGIRVGKGELYDWLQQRGGLAFVPQEDVILQDMSHQREGLECVVYPIALSKGLVHQLEGEYNLKNIASAVAVATYLRVDRADIADAIAHYAPQNNRSQRHQTLRNTLVIDCYNANPSSMEASISNFIAQEFSLPKLLILGDMFELGQWSLVEHQRIIELALNHRGGCGVILIGENFAEAAASIDIQRVTLYPTREELEAELRRSPVEGYAILIKGSRGVGLEHIVKLL